MSFVVAPDSVTELLVVEARWERLKVVIWILLLRLFTFSQRSGATGEGDRIKGVAISNGGVVDFRD